MDQEFGACVLHMLPTSVEDASSQQLIQDLYYSIKTSSEENVTRVLDFYKKLIVKRNQDLKKWSHLEFFAGIMCNLRSPEEKHQYLMQCFSLIDEGDDIRGTRETLSKDQVADIQRKPTESVYAESFENFEKISDKRSAVSYGGNGWQQGSSDATLQSLSDPYFSNMVLKVDIIKSIPYLVLGTPSTLFELKDKMFTIPGNIPNGESQQLHDIIEAGLLYLHLQIKVESLKRYTATSNLKVAFLTFIQSKLRDYSNFVNTFSSHLNPNDPFCFVYQHLYPEILKLRTYMTFIEKFDNFSGEELLTMFQLQKRNGDPVKEKFAADASNHLLQPYMNNIYSWLISGKISNTSSDFFVLPSDKQAMGVRLATEKIPKFIPPLVAKKIYIVGKSLRYLEQYCAEVEWVGKFANKYSFQFQLLGSSAIDQRLFEVVDQQYEEINYRINTTLQTTFYYFETLNLLKDILLMGKSDFIDCIIQNSEDLFNQPSQLLESHHLTKCLQTAVQQSSLRNRLNKFDNNLLINRLDARLLELAHGSSGWDVFTLDYLVDEPLSTVIDINQQGSRREYLRIFNFLWRIKKNEYIYEQEWRKNSSVLKLFRKLNHRAPLIRDLLNKVSMINVLKNQIQAFTKKIEQYCFENIIEHEFKKLLEELKGKNTDRVPPVNVKVLKNGVKVSNGILKPDRHFVEKYKELPASDTKGYFSYDLEDLKKAHSSFLSNILRHPLLYSGKGASLGTYTNQLYPTTLVLLMDMSYEFVLNYVELNNIIHEICIQINLNPAQNLPDQITRFNITSRKLLDQWRDFDNECNAYIKDLKWDENTEVNKLSKILH
ncbi:unnamed protein product [Kluyveromyces dobzhanskii CBS 2104]|uniref:Spindle pole body component n=1 Tax=Kluyveromyces dobzhanskii CBS 2104 TaxID=1427455 RepID=A0A0A8LDR2_9SACH|nr:unnamed protein product [Kluyveromyces dobzhanskii CBS 2104]